MKFLLAFFVFFLTLGLTTQTIASESKKADAACTAETATQPGSGCAPAASTSASDYEHKEEANAARMESLFPTKQALKDQTQRPVVTELKSPAFLSKQSAGNVELQWKNVAGADTYHLQVATDPNFKWLLVDDHFVKGTSFNFDKAETGHRYYWRVASFNTQMDSMFSKSLFVSSVFDVK
jgi:hypothetical protein